MGQSGKLDAVAPPIFLIDLTDDIVFQFTKPILCGPRTILDC